MSKTAVLVVLPSEIKDYVTTPNDSFTQVEKCFPSIKIKATHMELSVSFVSNEHKHFVLTPISRDVLQYIWTNKLQYLDSKWTTQNFISKSAEEQCIKWVNKNLS